MLSQAVAGRSNEVPGSRRFPAEPVARLGLRSDPASRRGSLHFPSRLCRCRLPCRRLLAQLHFHPARRPRAPYATGGQAPGLGHIRGGQGLCNLSHDARRLELGQPGRDDQCLDHAGALEPRSGRGWRWGSRRDRADGPLLHRRSAAGPARRGAPGSGRPAAPLLPTDAGRIGLDAGGAYRAAPFQSRGDNPGGQKRGIVARPSEAGAGPYRRAYRRGGRPRRTRGTDRQEPLPFPALLQADRPASRRIAT